MTSHRIGVNLRVSGNCDQGGRKYMEDYHAIKFVKKDDRDYEFAYFGIFDGHGGPEASRFARDNLLNEITKYDQFWTDDDEDVQFAIRSGFLDTHQAMWKELDKWPRTVSGLPSTSGTTASIAIIKKSKLYIGHVGDSGIVLGCDEGPRNAIFMKPRCLTKDHKPDNPEEKERIERSGGSVVAKAGVQRVVWSRPKVSHKGPVRRSTQIDKIPFLAVARSLGDLWSYDYYKGQFVVSPDPDVSVMTIEPGRHRCLILGSDGLWNMLSPGEAVSVVTDLEMHFEDRVIHDPMVAVSYWINPAEKLVTRALNRWRSKMMKADNISCVVVLIDPLGPSKLTILRKRREDHFNKLNETKSGTARPGNSSTSSSSAGSSRPASASVATKANHNQNNLGGREKEEREGEGGALVDAKELQDQAENKDRRCLDTENQVKNGSAKGAAIPANKSYLAEGGSHSSSGHDASSSSLTLDPALRASSHPLSTSSQMTSRAAFMARVRRTYKASVLSDSALRHPLLPRRLSHPLLRSKFDEDDSVQAASAMSVSPAFNTNLASTLEDPSFRNSRSQGNVEEPSCKLTSTISDPFLNLVNFDGVKSSDPLSKSSAPSTTRLSQSHKESGLREQRRRRPSGHDTVLYTARQHTSSYLASSSDITLPYSPGQTEKERNFHTSQSVNTSLHDSQSLDKVFSTNRLLNFSTSRCAGKSDKSGTDSKLSSSSMEGCALGNKSLKTSSLNQAVVGRSVKKPKRHRDFGLLHRTRSTLRRARKAARKAFCPENRPFVKETGSKRKNREKSVSPGLPSAKRLKESEDLQYSV